MGFEGLTLSVFAHILLISGPIDSKQSANESELNSR
jgi:hypothetical protein